MTQAAQEFVEVTAGIYLWQLYDPDVKADFYSTALQTPAGIVFVDPIPLNEAQLPKLAADLPILGVVATNVNHCRAASEFSGNFSCPIFAHQATITHCGFSSVEEIRNGDLIATNLAVIEIPGAPEGEIAIHQPDNGGSLVVGDALINFEPHGFTFLPPKYCTNAKLMRRSLQRLLDYEFERMLFAHGTPLIHSARKKLEQLLRDDD